MLRVFEWRYVIAIVNCRKSQCEKQGLLLQLPWSIPAVHGKWKCSVVHTATLGYPGNDEWDRIPSVISVKVMRASCTIQNIIRIQTSALIANPSKWPNTLKQLSGSSGQVIWVCLTILWCFCGPYFSKVHTLSL